MGLVEIQRPGLWLPPERRVEVPRRRRPFERRFARSRTMPEEQPLLVTPSIVQTGSSSIIFDPSSPVTATVSGTTAGNALLVVAWDFSQSTTWGTPSDGHNSYTLVSPSGPGCDTGTANIALATSIAGGAVTISQPYTGTAPGYAGITIVEMKGVNGFDAASNDPSNNNGFSTSPVTCPGWSLTHAGDLVIAILATQGDQPGLVISAPTSPFGLAPSGVLVSYYVNASSGAQGALTGSWTGGASDEWSFIAAGFTASPSTGIAVPFWAAP